MRQKGKATATKPASISSGSETKASKNPTPAKKPKVQAVQYVQIVESFEGPENPRNSELPAREIVEDLEAALEKIREIANDLSANMPDSQILGGNAGIWCVPAPI